jgi:hypothetical protein
MHHGILLYVHNARNKMNVPHHHPEQCASSHKSHFLQQDSPCIQLVIRRSYVTCLDQLNRFEVRQVLNTYWDVSLVGFARIGRHTLTVCMSVDVQTETRQLIRMHGNVRQYVLPEDRSSIEGEVPTQNGFMRFTGIVVPHNQTFVSGQRCQRFPAIAKVYVPQVPHCILRLDSGDPRVNQRLVVRVNVTIEAARLGHQRMPEMRVADDPNFSLPAHDKYPRTWPALMGGRRAPPC